MLNSELMSKLLKVQSNFTSVAKNVYHVSVRDSPCGKGPTNCQNQW